MILSDEPCRVLNLGNRKGEEQTKRPKRARVPIDPYKHEELFVLLTTLRAANAKSLFELFFKKAGVPWRTAMRRLNQLVSAGYLGHLRLDGARCVYHLKTAALSTSARVHARAIASTTDPLPERQAMYCWLRSTLWASLTEGGYTVGQTANDLYALRRYMLDTLAAALPKMDGATQFSAKRSLDWMRGCDQLSIPVCASCASCGWRGAIDARDRCRACRATTTRVIVPWSYRCRDCGAKVLLPSDASHARADDPQLQCGGELREVGVASYDIAWRKRGHAHEVIVLFVDNPSRSLDAQIEELPFLCHDSPRLPVILRSVDPRARFDRAALRWVSVAPRHAELMKIFTDGTKRAGRVKILDHRPDIQAYYAR